MALVSDRKNPFSSLKQGTSDTWLATLIILIIGMMIVPLPTGLLDVLIVSNISIGVLMVLIGMYIPNGLAFTTLPTVLLITTLYRLALNISSTRLILLQAYAGQVIQSFGDFVVRGNYVVGAVIFLILTVVQYLVIAKGSERVAEVGARFSLDAMPGRQMAIDADLRSGALTTQQAQQSRRALTRENQFYGAMDGAMKFVKGDAIAGIFITCVNILAGIGIGIGMHDMDVMESLRVYGLLTVGDGLVSQIPSLLISTSAGVVVTRVASEQENGSLSSDIGGQLFGNPRVLGMTSVFLAALSLVPGLPALPFLILAALLAIFSRAMTRPVKQLEDQAIQTQGPGTVTALMPALAPVAIHLGKGLKGQLDEENHSSETLPKAIEKLRQQLFIDLGIPLPRVEVRVAEQLDTGSYQLALQEIIMGQGVCPNPEKETEQAISQIVGHLRSLVEKRAQDFIGLQEVQFMLDLLEHSHPALVHNVVPKPVSLALLADILRRLVREGVSIRPLREILETLASHANSDLDAQRLTEAVRRSLNRHITYRYAENGVISLYSLDPEVEETIREAIQRSAAGRYLALAPDLAHDIIRSISKASKHSEAREPLILLTQSDIRPFVKELIETDLDRAVVLSHQELAPEVRVKPLKRIAVTAD